MKRKGIVKRIRVLLALFTLVVFLTACKKKECAVCGEPASRKLKIENQSINICSDCYETYVEIQKLFQEEWDD